MEIAEFSTQIDNSIDTLCLDIIKLSIRHCVITSYSIHYTKLYEEKLDDTQINLSARGDYEYLAVFINSQETPGEGNYYKWDIYINNELLYESEYLAFASDELVDGNYIYDFEILTDLEDNEEDKVFHMGDTVRVEQSYKFV